MFSKIILESHRMLTAVRQVLLGRGEAVPQSPAGPVIVCTRNDDLDAVVEATPSERRKGALLLQL